MAARKGIAEVNGVSTGTSIKTLIQLVAATNHAIDVVEVGIGFHGTNNTNAPILVQLTRQGDAGTSSALTSVKADDSVGDTLDTTARDTFTGEPASNTDVLRSWSVHPQTSMVYQLHDLAGVTVGAGDRLGLRVTAADAVDADAYICFVE